MGGNKDVADHDAEPRDKVTLTSVFDRNVVEGVRVRVGGGRMLNRAEQSGPCHRTRDCYQGRPSAHSRPFEPCTFLESSVGGE